MKWVQTAVNSIKVPVTRNQTVCVCSCFTDFVGTHVILRSDIGGHSLFGGTKTFPIWFINNCETGNEVFVLYSF